MTKREKYKPSNPEPPAGFVGNEIEFWKLLMELYYKVGTLEGRLALLCLVVAGMFGVVLAKLQGAF